MQHSSRRWNLDYISAHRGMATDIGEPNATSYEVPISSRSQTDSIPFHQLGAHNHMQYMAHAPKGTAQNDILSQPEINPPEGDDEGPPNILPSGETLVPCVDHRESGEKFDADLQVRMSYHYFIIHNLRGLVCLACLPLSYP